MTQTIRVAKGFDAHCHFRRPVMGVTVKHIAEQFGRAVAMGNTEPAIVTADDSEEYAKEICSAAPHDANFEPVMTIMLARRTTPEIVTGAGKRGIKILKFIPFGVSTNSKESVSLEELPDYYPVLEAAQNCGMIFSGHWESLLNGGKAELPDIDREEAAIPFLDQTVKKFPQLKFVVEHASTKRMVDYVRQSPPNVRATLTVHHAMLTYLDVYLEVGIINKPHNYCKPIAKHREDRDAVNKATISGDFHFIFGSDNAPHLRTAKEKIPPAAGIYLGPTIRPLLAQIFEQNNALSRMSSFCTIGENFYGLPQSSETITLVKQDWQVPPEYNGIVPFMAGQTLHWQVAD
jgi:dihydroorotase